MTTSLLNQIPPGPIEKYNPSQDLMSWLTEQFKGFGDIYRASVYGTNVYVVSDPELADHVLRVNWQNYRKGQAIKRIAMLLGNGLMVSEGDFWKKQRRMIQPAFHEGTVGKLMGLVLSANRTLLDRWKQAAHNGENVNITTDISHMVLAIILGSIFGDDYQQVAPHFEILSGEPSRDLQFANAFRPLGKLVVEVANQRRKNGTSANDILGMLMVARDRQSDAVMSDNQLASEILTIIVAGHETTASTLNWMWYLLSCNPEAETKLAKELGTFRPEGVPTMCDLARLPYAAHVIEETLRLYPPGWLITRKALKEDRLGDYIVPAGTEVYISPYLIQRHPALWEFPEMFIPERFESDQSRTRHAMSMLPFLAGPRKCSGESHARMEMQIHLIMIAQQLRLTRVGQEPVEIDAGVNLRSKHDFIMRPENRC